MIRKITERQIREKMDRFMDHGFGTPAPDRIRLLEIGPNPSFDRVHLWHATQLPPDDKNIEIIAYGDDQGLVRQRLTELEGQGYLNLYFYEGGKAQWLIDGLPQQSSDLPADRLSSKLPEDVEGGATVRQKHQPRTPDAHARPNQLSHSTSEPLLRRLAGVARSVFGGKRAS